MSYTTALGVTHNERPEYLHEFRNSYGWSPSIWRRLLLALGHDDDWFRDDSKLLWLWKVIEDLPEWQQVPLVLTFDTGIVPKAEYRWAAEQLRTFDQRLPENPTYVNHIPSMADLLDSDIEHPWFGVWGTSVSENPFDPWDNEADDYGSGIPLEAGSVYVLERHRGYLLSTIDAKKPPAPTPRGRAGGRESRWISRLLLRP